MKIRVATPDDAAAMSRVLVAIVAVTGRQRPTDPDFTLAQYIGNPSGIRCSVAVDANGGVLGFQSLTRAVSGNPYGVEEGWGIIGTHIDPRAHRQGIGRALFAASRDAAVRAGLPGIVASIGRENEMGLRYYEAVGFRTQREDDTRIHKALVLPADS